MADILPGAFIIDFYLHQDTAQGEDVDSPPAPSLDHDAHAAGGDPSKETVSHHDPEQQQPAQQEQPSNIETPVNTLPHALRSTKADILPGMGQSGSRGLRKLERQRKRKNDKNELNKKR
jgi:hypothetical protein